VLGSVFPAAAGLAVISTPGAGEAWATSNAGVRAASTPGISETAGAALGSGPGSTGRSTVTSGMTSSLSSTSIQSQKRTPADARRKRSVRTSTTPARIALCQRMGYIPPGQRAETPFIASTDAFIVFPPPILSPGSGQSPGEPLTAPL